MSTPKVALITGSSRGIGAATALLFAKKGYHVAVNYLTHRDKAETVVTHIQELGVKSIAIQVNLNHEADIERMFTEIDQQLGVIDVLVNNAGISSGKQPIEEITTYHLEHIYRTNVFSTFICCREAIKRMKLKRQGAIVNVSSLAAKLGGFHMSAYASSKAAINTLTIGLAKEVAELGIRVNAVAPGVIDTDMHQHITDDRTKHFQRSIPMQRMGHPEEVADLIYFLTSEQSSYINGEIISITGGK